jgi:hypothetical protein
MSEKRFSMIDLMEQQIESPQEHDTPLSEQHKKDIELADVLVKRNKLTISGQDLVEVLYNENEEVNEKSLNSRIFNLRKDLIQSLAPDSDYDNTNALFFMATENNPNALDNYTMQQLIDDTDIMRKYITPKETDIPDPQNNTPTYDNASTHNYQANLSGDNSVPIISSKPVLNKNHSDLNELLAKNKISFLDSLEKRTKEEDIELNLLLQKQAMLMSPQQGQSGGGGLGSLFSRKNKGEELAGLQSKIDNLKTARKHRPLVQKALSAQHSALASSFESVFKAQYGLDIEASSLNDALESNQDGQDFLIKKIKASKASGIPVEKINDMLHSKAALPNTTEFSDLKSSYDKVLKDPEISFFIENTNKYYNSLADNVKNIETNMKTLTDNDVPVIDENLTEAQEILNKQNITNAKISNPESAPIHNNDEENKKMMERITDFIKNFLAKITALFSKS